MKPKYYFPIKGEYRFQVDNGELAYKLGMPKENILLKQMVMLYLLQMEIR